MHVIHSVPDMYCLRTRKRTTNLQIAYYGSWRSYATSKIVHWCSKTSSATTGRRSTSHTGINVLQAMVDEETSHGTHFQLPDAPWRLNQLLYTARRHKEFANNLLLDSGDSTGGPGGARASAPPRLLLIKVVH